MWRSNSVVFPIQQNGVKKFVSSTHEFIPTLSFKMILLLLSVVHSTGISVNPVSDFMLLRWKGVDRGRKRSEEGVH